MISVLFNFCVNELCRNFNTWVTMRVLSLDYKSQYSLAVTSPPNLSWYAQPELLMIVQIIYLNLQRYTVAGSCGVTISVS